MATGAGWPLAAPEIKAGIIGLDTSHAPAFAKIINLAAAGSPYAGVRITHAYPHGSRDIESSVSRIPRYTDEVKALGVQICDSIAELLQAVDVVFLETNDGRLHLEQAREVFAAGKKVFIDKPLAANLKDAKAIIQLAKEKQVPFFSASSLRFSPTTVAVARGEKIGSITGADVYSPATLEPTHTSLFWYGIHGVEALLTLMGPGCIQVTRFYTAGIEVVVGQWEDGRLGTFRGLRNGKTGCGGTAYGTEGITTAGGYEGYEPLAVEIVRFFKTGVPPITPADTLEVFAFMAAAEESKRLGGQPVTLASVLAQE